MTTVYSENPESDLWREILQFTYEANITRYLNKNGYDASEDIVNCIAGSFLQACEYYEAAKTSNLQISPLLLYYGSTNLLYGVVNLLTGSIKKINNHGMKIIIPDNMKFIADTEIKFVSPLDGGVHVITKSLGYNLNLMQYGDWCLREFLDSIAEISFDYTSCYDVNVCSIAMLDVFNTPDGMVEKLYFSKEVKEDMIELLQRVEGFKDSYLNVSIVDENKTGKEYFVLRHKMNGKDISEQSYSGRPYLRAGHIKNGKLVTIPTMLNMYIGLFALASLCRYHPKHWSPFVLKDSTGEKLLIEKFMYYARRQIPNYALNILMGNDVQYSYNRYSAIDTIKLVGEHQVQDMIERNVKKELDKQYMYIKGKI